uniref:uncharacterized protein LOC120336414 n=1 Tax=Styela clava TaxID=7725 RepID=UPI0019398D28|nr:uncharacterized protein LOC120336414 [Styela clava]
MKGIAKLVILFFVSTFIKRGDSRGCIPHVIENISTDICSSEISIKWKPHTAGIPYTITIRPINNSLSLKYEDTTVPKSTTLQVLRVQLSENTEYELDITGCPTRTFVTGKDINPPSGILYPQFQNMGLGKLCNVQTVTLSNDFDSLRITVTSSPRRKSLRLNAPAPKDQIRVFNATRDDRSFLFTTEPNKVYKSFVRAINCGGPGLSYRAEGFCKTDSAVPEAVSTPVLIYSSSANELYKIKLYPANETNGPVSCYFILVHGHHNSETEASSLPSVFDTESPFSSNHNIAKSRKEFPNDVTYIAAAIPSQKMKTPYIEVNLGDNSTTACDAMSVLRPDPLKIPDTENIKQHIFEGQNFALPRNMTFRFAVVLSTPISLPDGVAYKASPVVLFQTAATKHTMIVKNTLLSERNTTTVVITTSPSTFTTGLVVGILVFVIAAFVISIIITKKRKRARGRQQKSKPNTIYNAPSTVRKTDDRFRPELPNLPVAVEQSRSTEDNMTVEMKSFRPTEKHLYASMKPVPSHSYENLGKACSSHYEIPLSPQERLEHNSGFPLTVHCYDTVYESNQDEDCEYFTIDA